MLLEIIGRFQVAPHITNALSKFLKIKCDWLIKFLLSLCWMIAACNKFKNVQILFSKYRSELCVCCSWTIETFVKGFKKLSFKLHEQWQHHLCGQNLEERIHQAFFLNITWVHIRGECLPNLEFFPWVLSFFLEFWFFPLEFYRFFSWLFSNFLKLSAKFQFSFKMYRFWKYLIIKIA